MLGDPGELVGALEGVRAGCILIRVTPRRGWRLRGFSYKPVKTLIARGVEALGATSPPRAAGLHVSPLLDQRGAPLGVWVGGWRSPGELAGPPRPLTVRAGWEYMVRVAWAGERARDAALWLVEAARASDLAEAELVALEEERLRGGFAHEASLALATPAQFKVVSWSGEPAYLTSPGPARLLQAPLRAALEAAGLGVEHALQAMAALSLYTAQTGGSWRRVTLYLDEGRPTAWALAGWARLSLTRQAPEAAGRLLWLLHRLALYVGVGKSRSLGLGMAGEPLGGGVGLPCLPAAIPQA